MVVGRGPTTSRSNASALSRSGDRGTFGLAGFGGCGTWAATDARQASRRARRRVIAPPPTTAPAARPTEAGRAPPSRTGTGLSQSRQRHRGAPSGRRRALPAKYPFYGGQPRSGGPVAVAAHGIHSQRHLHDGCKGRAHHAAGSVFGTSRASTSERRKRRHPPGVRQNGTFPASAQRFRVATWTWRTSAASWGLRSNASSCAIWRSSMPKTRARCKGLGQKVLPKVVHSRELAHTASCYGTASCLRGPRSTCPRCASPPLRPNRPGHEAVGWLGSGARQWVEQRRNGTTPIKLRDVDELATALGVDAAVFLMEPDEGLALGPRPPAGLHYPESRYSGVDQCARSPQRTGRRRGLTR